MSITAAEKKSFRQIAHHLDAVVIVGDQGVTEGVLAEAHRALKDHELIKVKLAISDRSARSEAGRTLAEQCSAEIVQSIGKIIVLFRANPEANPKLSNLQRFG